MFQKGHTYIVSSGRTRFKFSLAILLVSLLAIVPGLTTDISYVRAAGNNIQLVSVSDNGTPGNNNSSYYRTPSLNSDGRYVVFQSYATNLVSNDINGHSDVFIRDLQSKITSLISVASDGTQGNDDSDGPSISKDGRYVAFYSYASNLVANDTNGSADIFLRDRQTNTTSIISKSYVGGNSNGHSIDPSISEDGRYIAFMSWAQNLVPNDINGCVDIFVFDRQTNTTTIVSIGDTGTQGNKSSGYDPKISSDGRYVTFCSSASNLVLNDMNNEDDIFVHDRQLHKTLIISISSDRVQGNNYSDHPCINSDGRYIGFLSLASNLIADDNNNIFDIFVHDQQKQETSRASITTAGAQANSASYTCSINDDGRYIVFDSEATNLVTEDKNGAQDVFVRDQQAGTTARVSVSDNGTEGNNNSIYPYISNTGNRIAFASKANSLVPNDNSGFWDVYVADNPLYSPPPVTIYVPDNYLTIQAAVDAASAGDTIVVRSGTYIENVNIYKSLTITGINHPVVDANLNRSAITISANDVSLIGFDVGNSGFGSEPYGGGIELNGVQRCHVKGNNASSNREGISLINSDNNTIISNRCTHNSDNGIRLWSQSPRTSSGNTIQNNVCSNNGHYGISTWSYVFQTVTTKDNIMGLNESSSNGYGGIYVGNSSGSTVSENDCFDNTAGAGIILEAYVGDTNINNTVTNNTCLDNKYGILLANSKNNSINNNEVLNSTGYGIYLQYGASNNHIYLNHFTDSGASNARSEESTNIWNSLEPITYSYNHKTYTSYLGNYWSDYLGSDVNGDGIGDSPYAIDSDQDSYPLLEQITRSASVPSATGTGTINLSTSNGNIESFTAVSQNDLPCGNLPANTSFPHGFLSYRITDIPPSSAVTITLSFPSSIATGAEYWQCNGGEWIDYTPLIGDDDGDEVLTLTITDGSVGDCDGQINGEISDPGGPALSVLATESNGGVSPSIPNRQLTTAQISLQYLSVNPQQAQTNQPLTVSGNVVNTGDQAGNYNLALKINGIVEQTRMVSVGPRATQPIKFTVTKSKPGTYTVDIGGQRDSFTVLGNKPGQSSTSNNKVIILMAMGFLAIVAITIFLISRRSA